VQRRATTMSKYIDSEELKKRFDEKLHSDVYGTENFRKALCDFICAVIDETPAANVKEDEQK
jgi:hypothetical protein